MRNSNLLSCRNVVQRLAVQQIEIFLMARSSSPTDLHSGPYTESHFQLKARLVKFGG